MSKITEDKNGLQKEIETKNHELQEKMRTIAQIKKIGRRYRTQYDELKVAHDKVLVTITAKTSIQSLKLKWVVVKCVLIYHDLVIN